MINIRGWWMLAVAALILIGLAVNTSAATTVSAAVCPPDPMSQPNGMSGPAKVCETPTEAPTEVPTPEPTAVPGVMRFVGTVTEGGGCGPGEIALTVSPDGSEIVMVDVTNFSLGGNPIPDLAVPFDPGIPIDPTDGTFSQSGPLPSPLDSVNVTFEGTFDFSVDPPNVGGILTAATVADGTVLCDATVFGAERTDAPVPEATAGPVGAPTTGSGPDAGSSSNGVLLLTLLLAGAGALALGATGLTVVRRRNA